MGFGFFILIAALTPVGFYASKKLFHFINGEDIEEDMLPLGEGILIATLVSFLTCFTLKHVEPEYKTYQYESERIYSLPMHPDVDGRFCLGVGMIKHRQYYYFYKSKSGGYAVDKMEAAKSTIYENDAILPCIRRRVYVRDRAFYRFFLGKEKIFREYEIVVPKGFTINNFFNANR